MVDIKVPVHLAVIPDGNRRFAKRLMENPDKAHEWGMKKAEEVAGWCRELGIRNITFYTLSLENLDRRPPMELRFLFALFKKDMDDIIGNPDHWINRTKTRVNFLGSTDRLPQDLMERIEKVREKTRNNSDWSVNLAIAYGGRQEIVDAAKMIAGKISSGELPAGGVDESVVRQNLYKDGPPDPDLIIRTGGEKRLSNFLTFQSAYSELAFTDTLWPDLGKEEFFSVVREFGERDRRFGK